MRKVLVLLAVLAFMPASVDAQERFVPQDTGLLEAQLTFSGEIISSGELESLNFSIYALPDDASSFGASTEHYVVNDDQGNRMLVLSWEDVSSASYEIDVTVRTRATLTGAERVPFPYAPPRSILGYLGPTENSEITPEMREKALELTQGAENGFEAVTALSTWISPVTNKDFEYDITLGDEIRSATFTYDERAGVCAGFTNLMVSMSRAVGIPARSVAGVIYGPDGNWGYHAWAEVYLDGWVPVDPTWNQVGWLDAAHVQLGTFEDGGDVKMVANYRALSSRSLVFTQPDVDVRILRTEPVQRVFDTSASTFPTRVGIGDSAVVEIVTENEAGGCIATATEVVSRVDNRGEKVVGVTDPVSIAVCPGDTTKSHFVLETRDDLPSGFVYFDLADIKTFLGDDITVDLTVDPGEDERSALSLSLDTTTAERGDRISFAVDTDAREHRVYSDLPISGDAVVAEKTGTHYIIAATDTGEVERREITVLDRIPFRISSVEKPMSVSCGEQFNVSFEIENLESFFQNINVEPIVSDELAGIAPFDVRVEKGGTETVTLTTALNEACTGEDQFVSAIVGDQRVHETIRVQKESDIAESVSSLLRRIIDLIFSIFGR